MQNWFVCPYLDFFQKVEKENTIARSSGIMNIMKWNTNSLKEKTAVDQTLVFPYLDFFQKLKTEILFL